MRGLRMLGLPCLGLLLDLFPPCLRERGLQVIIYTVKSEDGSRPCKGDHLELSEKPAVAPGKANRTPKIGGGEGSSALDFRRSGGKLAAA